MKKVLSASLLLRLSASEALDLGATFAQWRGVREPSLRTLTLREWAEEDYALSGEWAEAVAVAEAEADDKARLEALVEVSGDLPHPFAHEWRPWFEVV
jgi:hypothetical protein